MDEDQDKEGESSKPPIVRNLHLSPKAYPQIQAQVTKPLSPRSHTSLVLSDMNSKSRSTQGKLRVNKSQFEYCMMPQFTSPCISKNLGETKKKLNFSVDSDYRKLQRD